MKNTFTPGPWTTGIARPCETPNISIRTDNVVKVEGDGVAVAFCGRAELDVVWANARLIASAPELMEELEKAIRELVFAHAVCHPKHRARMSDVIDSARALILETTK